MDYNRLFHWFKLNKETDNATVRIVINNNKPIDYYEGKIRTPYPNKGILPIFNENGRKSCYGFPLKFNSLKELMNVHTINIEWEIEIENTIITTSIKYDIDILTGIISIIKYYIFTIKFRYYWKVML